ncbi:MAG: mevalonate kinase [Nitrosopumilaceae archaeon]|nr:mevalonate kinase [Nitrosopumilaceae archaeon]
MISKASAPGKVILFGEHFVVYGVSAILCAIDKRVTVISEKIPLKEIIIKSTIGELQVPTTASINEINSQLRPFFYLAKKVAEKFSYNDGLKITIESEIPVGVGLGSSSACCVAAAGSLTGLFETTSKDEIRQLAIEAEKSIYPNTSGADCTVCTIGGIIKYNKQLGHTRIDSKPKFDLVIANSNVVHSTDNVVSNVKLFRDKNESKFLELCEKEEKLISDVFEALKNNDTTSLGNSVMNNQNYLETIGVSNKVLQEMVQVANSNSYGSKITGAGDGGCIFAITDENNREKTIEELSKKYDCFSVKIDFKGLDTF